MDFPKSSIIAKLIEDSLKNVMTKYLVIPNFLPRQVYSDIDPISIAEQICRGKKYQTIFQNTDLDNRFGDRKRFQSSDLNLAKIFTKLVLFVHQVASKLEHRRAISTMNILVSKPGCMEQSFHTDHDPKAEEVDFSLGLIISIQEGTTIEVMEANGCSRTVRLDPGTAIIFKGSCIHAGSAYSNLNARIHFFLDVSNTRKEGFTYYKDILGEIKELPYLEQRVIHMNSKLKVKKILKKIKGRKLFASKIDKLVSTKL